MDYEPNQLSVTQGKHLRKCDMTKEEIMDEIFGAFRDTKLEDGIGIYEADCIDDYLKPDSEEYFRWKKLDERNDWTKLLPVFLNREGVPRFSNSCWIFMDAKGKRFVLPCFLIQELEDYPDFNPLYNTLTEGFGLEDLDILSQRQVDTILKFIEYQVEVSIQKNNDAAFDEYYGYLQVAKEKLSKRS